MPAPAREPRRGSTGVFAGRDFEPTELDVAILKLLPDEGAKLGKYLPNAMTVSQIKKALADPVLTSDMVSGRVRLMAAHGLTAVIRMGTKPRGWQRTDKGKASAR